MDFAQVFQESIGNNHNLLIMCECSIQYDGRAQSFLTEGDRTLLIKGDQTLLVHQPEGNNPVNYMKQGSSHSLMDLGDGSYVLKSSHLSLKEYMDITISKIYHFHSQKLEDSKKIILKGTERDMAEMIMGQPHLISPGFKPLSMEEHTKYGFIDVFGYDRDTLVVVECKRYTGDLKAVTQLRRYVEKIKESKGIEAVQGVLACPKISPNALKMLYDLGFDYRSISPPNYLEKYKTDQKSLTEF